MTTAYRIVVLQHRKFQALASLWRRVDMMMRRLDTEAGPAPLEA